MRRSTAMCDDCPYPPELVQPFVEPLKRLLPGTAEAALLTRRGAVCWSSFDAGVLDDRLISRLRKSAARSARRPRVVDPARRLATIPVLCDKELVGAILVRLVHEAGESTDRAVDRTSRALNPLLDRLGRHLGGSAGQEAKVTPREDVSAPREDVHGAGEGLRELEWLIRLGSEEHACADDEDAIERMLAAATEEVQASFGTLALSGHEPDLTYATGRPEAADCEQAYRQQARPYLMTYMQRRVAPLVANRPDTSVFGRPACKVLAVPVVLRIEGAVGVLTFCKAATAPDFSRRQVYAAAYIARLIENLLARRYDPATGLLSRAMLEREAKAAIAADDRTGHAVVCMDIDRLHVFNEAFGFDAGDRVIARVATLLRVPYVPADALCGRIAGDRFLIFLPGCGPEEARRCVQSIQRQVDKVTVEDSPLRIALSVTCGIAGVPPASASFSRAISAAELACRAAKRRGGNGCEIYADADDSAVHRHDDILGIVRLRAVLDHERLRVFARKIVPLDDRAGVSGIECSVRVLTENEGLASSSELRAAARRYQLSRAVDRWMIKRVFAALSPPLHEPFRDGAYVVLEISEQSLHDDTFLPYLENRIVLTDMTTDQIAVEIADSVVASNEARAQVMIRRFRNVGYRVALGGVGMNQRSLRRLEHLRPDRLTIDHRTTRDVLSSPAAAAAVRAIVDLADALNIECVAERVESDAIARKLGALGVRRAQGDALHEAESLHALLEALGRNSSREWAANPADTQRVAHRKPDLHALAGRDDLQVEAAAVQPVQAANEATPIPMESSSVERSSISTWSRGIRLPP